MLKIMYPTATFTQGLMRATPDKFIFHIIHSRTASLLVGESGPSVPMPKIFQRFGTSKQHTDLDLRGSRSDPAIAILRSLLSPAPYLPNATLSIGFVQQNGVPVIHRSPVVNYAGGSSEPIKIPTTLMVADNAELLDAHPLGEDAEDYIKFSTICKNVIINENLNMEIEFDDFLNQGDVRYVPSTATPGKSIIKHNAQSTFGPTFSKEDSIYHAQLFQAITNHSLVPGDCPASPYNTILVMNNSQNSFEPLQEEKISSIQNLFLKHIVLRRMGMENVIDDFVALFDCHVSEADQSAVNKFEYLAKKMTNKAYDAVFFLNSIGDAKFQLPIKESGRESTRAAVQKYFLMFRPKDYANAVNFSATIIDLLSRGEPFQKLVHFLSLFMPINNTASDSNVLKIYALLTS